LTCKSWTACQPLYRGTRFCAIGCPPRAHLLPGAHPSEQSKPKGCQTWNAHYPDRLSVGVTHSEGTRTVGTVFHQEQDVPHAQPREECVTLYAGRRLFPEGEAFPVAVPGGLLSC
jgi:hypothetical protein